jgi:hypothetical protein
MPDAMQLEIRINTTNTQPLDLTVVMETNTPDFTNWLRDLDTVETVELREKGGKIWSVIE